MGQVGDLNSVDLVRAVMIWTGWGQEAKPLRNESELAKHFDSETAMKLITVITSLEDDFYSSDARYIAADLAEMEKIASDHFRKMHPEIAEEIVKAFAWCYSFDFK